MSCLERTLYVANRYSQASKSSCNQLSTKRQEKAELLYRKRRAEGTKALEKLPVSPQRNLGGLRLRATNLHHHSVGMNFASMNNDNVPHIPVMM